MFTLQSEISCTKSSTTTLTQSPMPWKILSWTRTQENLEYVLIHFQIFSHSRYSVPQERQHSKKSTSKYVIETLSLTSTQIKVRHSRNFSHLVLDARPTLTCHQVHLASYCLKDIASII